MSSGAMAKAENKFKSVKRGVLYKVFVLLRERIWENGQSSLSWYFLTKYLGYLEFFHDI